MNDATELLQLLAVQGGRAKWDELLVLSGWDKVTLKRLLMELNSSGFVAAHIRGKIVDYRLTILGDEHLHAASPSYLSLAELGDARDRLTTSMGEYLSAVQRLSEGLPKAALPQFDRVERLMRARMMALLGGQLRTRGQ